MARKSTDMMLPPHNVDAEKAVVGSLLIDDEAIYKVRSFLKPQALFTPENQWVYDACWKLVERGETINQITVAHELNSMGHLDEVGGTAYLSHLVSIVPTSLHIEHYARVVLNCYIQRKTINLGSIISDIGYTEADPNKIISQITDGVLHLQEAVAQPQLLSPKEWAEKATIRYSTLGEGKKVSISTGIAQLDWATGGIFPSEYWVLIALPRIGKTSLVTQIARTFGNFGNVLFASLEMSPYDISDRWVASETGKKLRTIRAGNYNENLGKDVAIASAKISEHNIYYFGHTGSTAHMGAVTTDMIYSVARQLKMAYGLSAIIVDYLQAAGDYAGLPVYERVSNISRNLNQMAKSLEVPVLAVASINREAVHRTDSRPKLSDIRGSGEVDYAVDVALGLYREIEKKYDESSYGDDDNIRKLKPDEAELIIIKQRQSDESGDITCDLKWDVERHLYYETQEVKDRYEIPPSWVDKD